jgi:hypothetical protein
LPLSPFEDRYARVISATAKTRLDSEGRSR